MKRAVCSAQDIQDLVAHRVREIPAVKVFIDDVTVRTPTRVEAGKDGCNWTIEVHGVPLQADTEVTEIVRIVRSYVNLADGPYSMVSSRNFPEARREQLIDAVLSEWRAS